MTLDEAIINLLTLHKVLSGDTDPIFLDAIKLGIEALKVIKDARTIDTHLVFVDLPGETKD